MGGFEEDTFEALVAAYNQSCAIDDCLSPLKKKQKSNDHVAAILSVANKATLPKVVNHGLSKKEFERLQGLKKHQIIQELDRIEGEYHKSWNKGALFDAMLNTYASRHVPETQATGINEELVTLAITETTNNIHSKIDVTQISVDAKETTNQASNSDDFDEPQQHTTSVIDYAVASTLDSSKQSFTSKNSNAGNSVECGTTSSVVKHFSKAATLVVPTATNMEVDESSDKGQEVIVDTQNDFMAEQSGNYFSAKQEFSQTQSNPIIRNRVMNSSPAVKPTRTSPTIVPNGIVDSAKKLLLSSNKKLPPPKTLPFGGSGEQIQPSPSALNNNVNRQDGHDARLERIAQVRALVSVNFVVR
jgi:hypothetical protein